MITTATEEIIEKYYADHGITAQLEAKIKQEALFKLEDAKLEHSLQNQNTEKLRAKAKTTDGTIIGVLDEKGKLLKVEELKDAKVPIKAVPTEIKTMTEKEEAYLRMKVLYLCYQGIKTLDYFIDKYPDHQLTKVEQVKASFYEITYYFDKEC